ncbi:MAG: hypothetical protein KatS3mg038_2201 [Candidatus Kapaibacterium sp.]|nr:MAG: hypothetical protein KatS3mg038_0759 [Candidatus Kapabacteria bacterium]GIV50297.1 MAG: hypothetical protein KatS3mg038_0818 [Candidatus Kapabacteria bacterium]GIV51680.1 MAG: hypothetical protein KatS3mg038_2201 [Candidatus Kapabacteria bacterium]
MKLWRAAHNSRVFRGACFAQDRRDAEAYLDNPGFGGPRLFCVEVQPTHVLDCTGRDGLRRLAAAYVRAADDDTLDDLRSLCWDRAQACGRNPDEIDLIDELADRWAGEMVFHVLEDEHGVLDALCRHYDWIVYEDDYPEGCITWLYTGRSPVDQLTEVTDGSQVFSGRV